MLLLVIVLFPYILQSNDEITKVIEDLIVRTIREQNHSYLLLCWVSIERQISLSRCGQSYPHIQVGLCTNQLKEEYI